MYPPACIHGDGHSLCPSCQACYDYDPSTSNTATIPKESPTRRSTNRSRLTL